MVNMVATRMCVPKRKDVTRSSGKLGSEELRSTYPRQTLFAL